MSSNLRCLTNSHTHGQFVRINGIDHLNLSSNDYLGIAADFKLQKEFLQLQNFDNEFLLSNSSSRLMTGNNEYIGLESELEKLYPQKRALVLGSGFLTNLGILPAVTTSNDLIIADKLVHASIIDGIKLSSAHLERYRHNDTDHLEKILLKHRANFKRVFIVTESIFSMDGDFAPLKELTEIKERFDCLLYIDEAHAFGLYGYRGAGVASAQKLDDKIDFIVATFGKALASQGAMVVCNETWHKLLINKMRTLIFSTALPPISLRWTKFVLENHERFEPNRRHLETLKHIIKNNLSAKIESHIFPIMVGDSTLAVNMATELRQKGFWVMPIRRPTVPPGTERLRISLSAAIDSNQLENFVCTLNKLWNNIG
jgi:8-amino-7-oxononanoate synthase